MEEQPEPLQHSLATLLRNVADELEMAATAGAGALPEGFLTHVHEAARCLVLAAHKAGELETIARIKPEALQRAFERRLEEEDPADPVST